MRSRGSWIGCLYACCCSRFRDLLSQLTFPTIAPTITANAPIMATMIGTPIFFILFEGFPEKFGFEEAFVGEGEGEDDVSDDVVDDEHDKELEVEELEGDVVDDVVEDGELVDDGVGGLMVVCMTAITATPIFFILFEGFPEEFGFKEAFRW